MTMIAVIACQCAHDLGAGMTALTLAQRSLNPVAVALHTTICRDCQDRMHACTTEQVVLEHG